MKKKKDLLFWCGGTILLGAICIYLTDMIAEYGGIVTHNLVCFLPFLFGMGIVLITWNKVETLIKRGYLELNKGRQEKYKSAMLYCKVHIEKYVKNHAEIVEDDAKRRKIGFIVLYDNSNLYKKMYDNYRMYYTEVEKHFCQSEFTNPVNWEVLLLDIKYIVCEYEKNKYLCESVKEKLKELCEELLYGSIEICENDKLELITCFEKMRDKISKYDAFLRNDSCTLINYIDEILKDFYVDTGYCKTIFKNQIQNWKNNNFEGSLEHYARLSSYITYRYEYMSINQLRKYLCTIDQFFYDLKNKLKAENDKEHYEEIVWFIDSTRLYREKLSEKLLSDNNIESYHELFNLSTSIIYNLSMLFK